MQNQLKREMHEFQASIDYSVFGFEARIKLESLEAVQASFFSSFEDICASNLQAVDADLDVNLNAIWIAVEVKIIIQDRFTKR